MTTDCVGGVWTYTLELARGLHAAGAEVVVAVMGGELAADQREELDGAPVVWDARPYRLEWMADPEADLEAAGAWLLELAGEHRPDVVHVNQFNFGALAWPCPVVVVAHSDVVTWWRAVHGKDPDASWEVYRRRVAAGLSAADLVIAPTTAMLGELRDAYDFSTPSAVVPNGRTMEAATPAAGEPIIAAVGRVWDEAKNLVAAARAAEGLPWPLLVAGAGAGAGGAQFLGRLSADEVAALLGRAAVFVEPARYEPFGLAALEAGLMGCALVLGDIPSLREVWADAATFVAPGDNSAIREALRSLLADPQLLRERQNASRQRAATFTVERMVRAYTQAYGQLLPAPADDALAAS